MANLPVREMVLYKHGVGFFVRQGTIDGEQIALTFREDEINDVLKSLAVFDQAGGQVLGIHYQTPMDKAARLASSSIKLSQKKSLRDLLRDLRGRQCELVFEETAGTQETINGRIIGIDEVENEESFIANISILTENGVQVFPYEALRHFTIADEQSAHDLSYFLDTSMAEDDRRVVTVRLTEGEHDLAVYYVAPSPTWRVSYRLVAETDENGSTGKALLQGWGLFDNRLEEDLDDVRVTLVAGQPISFIYDLYASKIPPRPTVEDESRIAPGPIEYAGGAVMMDAMESEATGAVVDYMMQSAPSPSKKAQSRARGLRPQQGFVDEIEVAPPPALNPTGFLNVAYDKPIEELGLSPKTLFALKRTGITSVGDIKDMLLRGSDAMLAIRNFGESNLQELQNALQKYELSGALSGAQGKDSGETFQYIVTTPVSVKRGESALVPIIGHQMPYERELLYNKEKLPSHPVAALRFENNSGLTLERGPVTLVEDGDYKGEAIVPFTGDNQQVYLPYAVELGVRVVEFEKSESVIAGLNIRDKALFEQRYNVETVTYVIENNTVNEHIVTIESEVRNRFELYDTPQPDSETSTERRWKVTVPAQGKAEFIRIERTLRYERKDIRHLAYEKLYQYLQNNWLDKNTFDQLNDILSLMQTTNENRRLIQWHQNERTQIYQQQEQLRANLGALQPTGQEAVLRNRLLQQLESTQDRLDAIESEINTAKDAIQRDEKQVETLINEL